LSKILTSLALASLLFIGCGGDDDKKEKNNNTNDSAVVDENNDIVDTGKSISFEESEYGLWYFVDKPVLQETTSGSFSTIPVIINKNGAFIVAKTGETFDFNIEDNITIDTNETIVNNVLDSNDSVNTSDSDSNKTTNKFLKRTISATAGSNPSIVFSLEKSSPQIDEGILFQNVMITKNNLSLSIKETSIFNENIVLDKNLIKVQTDRFFPKWLIRASTPSAKVNGHVYSSLLEDGNANGIEFLLTNKNDTTRVYKTTTDVDGNFLFEGVIGGYYELTNNDTEFNKIKHNIFIRKDNVDLGDYTLSKEFKQSLKLEVLDGFNSLNEPSQEPQNSPLLTMSDKYYFQGNYPLEIINKTEFNKPEDAELFKKELLQDAYMLWPSFHEQYEFSLSYQDGNDSFVATALLTYLFSDEFDGVFDFQDINGSGINSFWNNPNSESLLLTLKSFVNNKRLSDGNVKVFNTQKVEKFELDNNVTTVVTKTKRIENSETKEITIEDEIFTERTFLNDLNISVTTNSVDKVTRVEKLIDGVGGESSGLVGSPLLVGGNDILNPNPEKQNLNIKITKTVKKPNSGHYIKLLVTNVGEGEVKHILVKELEDNFTHQTDIPPLDLKEGESKIILVKKVVFDKDVNELSFGLFNEQYHLWKNRVEIRAYEDSEFIDIDGKNIHTLLLDENYRMFKSLSKVESSESVLKQRGFIIPKDITKYQIIGFNLDKYYEGSFSLDKFPNDFEYDIPLRFDPSISPNIIDETDNGIKADIGRHQLILINKK
jgi:hypothetical protein